MIKHNLPNDVVGFSRAAVRLGEILAASAGIDRNDAVDAAQWLLPLCGGRGAPETARGLQHPELHNTEIRKLAAAANTNTAALDLLSKWNSITTPNEAPLRYLVRWL